MNGMNIGFQVSCLQELGGHTHMHVRTCIQMWLCVVEALILKWSPDM